MGQEVTELTPQTVDWEFHSMRTNPIEHTREGVSFIEQLMRCDLEIEGQDFVHKFSKDLIVTIPQAEGTESSSL